MLGSNTVCVRVLKSQFSLTGPDTTVLAYECVHVLPVDSWLINSPLISTHLSAFAAASRPGMPLREWARHFPQSQRLNLCQPLTDRRALHRGPGESGALIQVEVEETGWAAFMGRELGPPLPF